MQDFSQDNLNNFLKEKLVCPKDKKILHLKSNLLICESNHKYYIVNNIPIMLLDDVQQTHEEGTNSLIQAKRYCEHNEIPDTWFPDASEQIDPFVKLNIGATCGRMWIPLINKLEYYPIPKISFPLKPNKLFLDIGCNWGRWSISAAKEGCISVGLDLDLDAIVAAKRVAKVLNVNPIYLVGDSRFLPFPSGTFDYVFSYSVIQHFETDDAIQSVSEISRVLKHQGTAIIQLANKFGLWNMFNQIIQHFKKPVPFKVRYWSIKDLKEVFTKAVGPTGIYADAYFNLNPDEQNIDSLPLKYKLVIKSSLFLKRMSIKFPILLNIADSIFIVSNKQ